MAKRKPANVNPRSARTMLATLRAFAGDFEVIKVSPDGTIEVKAHAPKAPVVTARAGKKAAKVEPEARPVTAIDSLGMKPPPFEGWGH